MTCAAASHDLPSLLSGRHDDRLWEEACALRQRYWGRAVFLRGIVEFSNYCRQNCLYCGLRKGNANVVRYRMSFEDVFEQAGIVAELGFGTLVLQSGEDPALDAAALADLIRRSKDELGLAVTLSLGERPRADYALWRKAGADRYLLKMETFDEGEYARLRPGKKLEERLCAYHDLADLGYETGTGLIAGLPGSSPDILAQDMEKLAELRPDMLSISPFTPHPDTPLGGHPALDVDDTLRLMALARLLVPSAHIPVTSALGLHGDAVRLKALDVGDVLMPSLTPEHVRARYNIYPGKNQSGQSPKGRAAALRDLLIFQGFDLPTGPGRAWRLEEKSREPGYEHDFCSPRTPAPQTKKF